jgi:ABC-2 type transport system permease protein
MLIWTALICGLIILDMALFQAFLNEGMFKSLEPVLNNPLLAPMLKGFGLEIEKLSDILGFYVIRNTPLILLLSGMFSILTSSSIFANEEYDKTAEFLYTRPITRTEIFISKVSACYILIIGIYIATLLTGYISLELFKTQDYNRASFFTHSIYGIFTSLSFASIGFLLSSFVKRGRGLFALSVGIVLGSYFLDLISKISESTKFIGYLSPFSYVDNNILVPDFSLSLINVTIFLITIIVLTTGSFLVFLRKDILN